MLFEGGHISENFRFLYVFFIYGLTNEGTSCILAIVLCGSMVAN